MKEYVLCYAMSIDNPDTNWVVLVDKKTPLWQQGKLNLPGGKVRNGEGILIAASRILEETTGLKTNTDDCKLIGRMFGSDWECSVVDCLFKGPFKCEMGHEELPMLMELNEVFCYGSRILPELRTIIPLCITGTPWQMLINRDKYHTGFPDYVLKVNDE